MKARTLLAKILKSKPATEPTASNNSRCPTRRKITDRELHGRGTYRHCREREWIQRQSRNGAVRPSFSNVFKIIRSSGPRSISTRLETPLLPLGIAKEDSECPVECPKHDPARAPI